MKSPATLAEALCGRAIQHGHLVLAALALWAPSALAEVGDPRADAFLRQSADRRADVGPPASCS